MASAISVALKLLAALLTVTAVYVLVTAAALGAQNWTDFEGQSAGLAVILDNVTGTNYWGTVLAAGAVISIFSVTLVTLYGSTRILFAIGRDGLLPSIFATVNPRTMTPVNNTVIVGIIIGLLAGLVPLDKLADMVSIGTLVAFSGDVMDEETDEPVTERSAHLNPGLAGRTGEGRPPFRGSDSLSGR